MGIIRKQAISGTIYTYLGALIGFTTTGLLFPRILKTEEIGLINLLLSYSVIFAQFGSLGFNSVTMRLFTHFRSTDRRHNGFLFIASIVLSIGFILSLICLWLYSVFFLPEKKQTSPLFAEYFWYLSPLVLFTIIFQFLDHYNKMLYNAVRGIVLKEFFVRVFIIICILGYYFSLFSFHSFVVWYIAALSAPALIIFVLLHREKQISFQPAYGYLSHDLKKSMLGVALFGLLTGATGLITLNIDRIMIESLLDENSLGMVGIYSTSFFFGTIIYLPSRALNKISSTIIADAYKNDKLKDVAEIYSKSALNQSIVGSLLFIGIWVNIDNIMVILTQDFAEGRLVIFFIALASLSDMMCGSASNVITLSKHYKSQAVLMFTLTVFVIITNLIFIPLWGIVGAAFASFISKLLINIVRHFFLTIKMKQQPYNSKFILVLLIAAFAYAIGYYIPLTENLIINIALKSIPVALVFYVLIITTKVSEDINQFNLIILKRLKLLKGE